MNINEYKYRINLLEIKKIFNDGKVVNQQVNYDQPNLNRL